MTRASRLASLPRNAANRLSVFLATLVIAAVSVRVAREKAPMALWMSSLFSQRLDDDVLLPLLAVTDIAGAQWGA